MAVKTVYRGPQMDCEAMLVALQGGTVAQMAKKLGLTVSQWAYCMNSYRSFREAVQIGKDARAAGLVAEVKRMVKELVVTI